MPAQSYSVAIVGNIETCRTEAEISDGLGNYVGIVYEDASGWHTELTNQGINQDIEGFRTAVAEAKERLTHFVNRMGFGAPQNISRGALALWLMIKDDGTAMGMQLGAPSRPKS